MFDEFKNTPVKPVENSKPKKSKKWTILLIFGIVTGILGIVLMVVGMLLPKAAGEEIDFSVFFVGKGNAATYSNLTGLALENASDLNAPAYCIQTPNGMDGARPQAGLTEAGVIFEAIAEMGITRFAAIYQNPGSAVIGPIRSLRLYYLQWDTPFDCTIVHAGGADDAIAAVRDGGYKDLSENYTYMYRGQSGNRLWNNLFTTAAYLKNFSSNNGYNTSNIKGFDRFTPEEANQARAQFTADNLLNIIENADGDTSSMTPSTTTINVNFGSMPSFNVIYDYNANTNTYDRSYQNGNAHEVYVCPDEDLGEVDPERYCTLKQMSPAVVVVMVVDESKASDNYHENITTTGSGKAYVFQNGVATTGKWVKDSVDSQIKFYDEDGKEVKLVPGQTFVSAIPSYGNVEY